MAHVFRSIMTALRMWGKQPYDKADLNPLVALIVKQAMDELGPDFEASKEAACAK